MEIKIYVDVLFLNDLFMDSLLLYISAKLMKIKPSFLKFFLAALVGAVFSTVMFFYSAGPLAELILKILVCVAMVEIAFFPRSLSSFLKQSSVFFAVSLLCGGIGFSLLYYTGLGAYFGAVYSGTAVYLNFPIYKLMLSAILCYIVLSLSTSAIKKYKNQASFIYDVKVCYNKREIQFKALYDSGNSLKDVATNKSVMILRWEKARKLFDTQKSFEDFFKENSQLFFPIPYKSVSGHSVMMAFFPECVKVNENEADVYAGISEIDFGKDYDGILPKDFDERIDRFDRFNSRAHKAYRA